MSWFVIHVLALAAAIGIVVVRDEIGSLWGVATTCAWLVALAALGATTAVDSTCLTEPYNCTSTAAAIYALAGVWYLSLVFLVAGLDKPFKVVTFVLSFPLALMIGITPV